VGEPAFLDIPVPDGALRAARWGSGAVSVLGLHGITASSLSLAPVARRLGEGFTLVAPDLRGRGGSAKLPGPYGFRAHAEDCAAVIEHLDAGPAIVVGESMGGFVAVVLAASRPELVARVVLVDGGLPPPTPIGLPVDQLLEAVLGPALARLSQTFPSRDSYHDFWRRHPALANDWNADIEAYLDYDLEACAEGVRSRVSEEAVRVDGGDGLINPEILVDALHRLGCEAHLLRATRNLIDQLPPLLPDAVVEHWQRIVPTLTDEVIADTNHYTLMLGEHGARAIARAIEDAAARG
jgi:lipase